jgi:hypothetical protein
MKDQAQKKFAQAPKPAKLGKSEPHARAEIARLERAVAAKLAATAAATRAPKKTAAPETGKTAKLAERPGTEACCSAAAGEHGTSETGRMCKALCGLGKDDRPKFRVL